MERKINTEQQEDEKYNLNSFNKRVAKALMQVANEQTLLEKSISYKATKFLVTKTASFIVLGIGLILEYIWRENSLFSISGSALIAFALASTMITEKMNRNFNLINNYSFNRTMAGEIELYFIHQIIEAKRSTSQLSIAMISKSSKDLAEEHETGAEQAHTEIQNAFLNKKQLLKENIEDEKKYRSKTDIFSIKNHSNELLAAIFGTIVWAGGDLIIKGFESVPYQFIPNIKF